MEGPFLKSSNTFIVFVPWILKAQANCHDHLNSSFNLKLASSLHPIIHTSKFKNNLFQPSFKYPLALYCCLLILLRDRNNKLKKEKGGKKKTEASKKEMACFVPFNNRNLDISFFVFRPTMVLVDELIETLKHFSGSTESLGCAQSSILRSIHGNMIIWYGAWMKKSSENKELLTAALLSMLTSISSMAILIEHGFFDAYAGESRDGSSAAKFSTGDAISINIIVPQSGDVNDLSYANLALFKSHFLKMEGASAGVCLNCQSKPKVASLYVWKSLQFCYSWIINSDHRRTMLPYLERFSLDIKYDIFRVVFVSSDNLLSYQHLPSNQMLQNEGASKEKGQVIMQD
ncbi:hypothetical protein P3X46_026617 [Hevea brasiliensis]|uniref:DUF7392 domain-containing protein n=1 Tax=Hevea brasiliensis TaxID=3981 RepID=A0ABQ9KYL7_HEVBR|nr:uncharacterized protein LOC110635588 [Hevea brasiliensis]KAJ9153141.1 hypothetical protein P3X46_026617 [Hevea brasiliensis]